MSDFDQLFRSLGGFELLRDVPMSEYTTFRAGGKARGMVSPKNTDELLAALRACRRFEAPYLVMGNGSNLLVRDGGLAALVIRLAGGFGTVRLAGKTLFTSAGMSLAGVARLVLNRGLRGLEWAGGIPGSVGGAVAMNAGAYGGQIADVLKRVTVIEADERVVELAVGPEDMGYRRSAFGQPHRIVIRAEFELAPDDGGARDRAKEYARLRREKQPLSYPSAGSTFKRPSGHYAGALIEAAGLKGASVGGAQVSELHAGFIINRGGATAGDIESLIRLVRQRVFEHSGVMLEPEVKIVGEEELPCTC